MKVKYSNNAELVIVAREGDIEDYNQALKIGEKMVEIGDVECVIASVEYADFVHITAVWDHYQANELKDLYKAAKKAVKAAQ